MAGTLPRKRDGTIAAKSEANSVCTLAQDITLIRGFLMPNAHD